MISVYSRKIDNNLTIRDEEAIRKYVNLIQWGRKNPVQFVEKILQIPLMDYQKMILSMSWTAEYAVWVCSRNAGKSFLLGCFLQARALLYPKSQIQILSAGSRQANETFQTMENIAKHQVKSLISNNRVFSSEIKIEKSDTDGFSHDVKKGSKVALLNGSSIRAVNGSTKTVVGKRANVLAYDEAGIISRDFYNLTEPFAAQSSDFKMGASYDLDVYPKEIPNTRLYIGSATDTSSLFWDKYCEAFKRMLAGDKRYFVVDLDCEIPLNPTINGIKTRPLLTLEEIERKRRENEISANREYHNIFDRFDIEDSVVSRSDIYSNMEIFIPQLSWGGKKHKYIISYDPASKSDNSPVLITEIYQAEDKQWQGRFVHMENLVITYGDGSRRPMRIEEQVQRLRELIFEFNGRDSVNPYENVIVLMDAGTGGQAPAIAQYLCQDWTDSKGRVRPGLYDENSEDMKRWAEKYPRAIPGRLKLLEPTRYRSKFFEDTKVLVASGNIKFPPNAPKNDVLILDDGTERRLGRSEIASLIQMDMMKEEMVSMVRSKSVKGSISFGLPPERRNKMNDDRNYVAIMACWWVNQVRINNELGESAEVDYSKFFNDQGLRQIGGTPSAIDKDDPWNAMFQDGKGRGQKAISPFKGDSPFKK